MTVEFIDDHSDQAIDRLASQFKDKTLIQGLVTAFVEPLQSVEDAIAPFFTQLSVSTAIGAQLDLLGEIVGVLRGGRTDSQYRLAIRAKIAINISKGTAEDAITVFSLITGATIVHLLEYFPGHVEIYANINFEYELLGDGPEAFAFDGGVDGLGFGDFFDSSVGGTFAYLEFADMDALYALMDSVLAGGVRLDTLGYWTDPPFAFDGDPDALGFGDVFDETVGGGFATIAAL